MSGRPGDEPQVVSRLVEIDGVPMAALVAEAAEPRAVVVALHGGATTSRYFDCPGHPRLSLLRTAAALGFTVVALDRPGYGGSGGEHASAATRVDLAYAATESLLAGRSRGAGVFLWGHSIGSELTIRMAADERAAGLLGVELAGTGRHHHATAVEIMDRWRTDPSTPRKTAGLNRLLWRPANLYPAEIAGGGSIAARGPAYEEGVVDRWAAIDFPRLAAQVRIPVHFTLGEHELVWQSGPAALADVAAMFTAAPRVEVCEQAGAGHNLSLGMTATAYHLKVLSFVEECAAGRRAAAVGKVT